MNGQGWGQVDRQRLALASWCLLGLTALRLAYPTNGNRISPSITAYPPQNYTVTTTITLANSTKSCASHHQPIQTRAQLPPSQSWPPKHPPLSWTSTSIPPPGCPPCHSWSCLTPLPPGGLVAQAPLSSSKLFTHRRVAVPRSGRMMLTIALNPAARVSRS